ncbi:MAG TPA: hypothetical protein VGD69_30340 [Herpetosiphonaceae bacterium]
MEYSTGRLTITSDDVTAWARLALRSIPQRLRPHAQHHDPANPLAAAAQHELATAQQLLKLNHFRAAGVIAGVALEMHLKHVARTHGLALPPSATIAKVQNTLRYAGLLSRPQRRLIGKLGAIRNQCVHVHPDVPSRAAIEKLIQGVAQLMEEVGKEQSSA